MEFGLDKVPQAEKGCSPQEISDALKHIEHTKALLRQYGNDPHSEYELLDEIAQQLKNLDVTPAEAIAKTDAFFNSKNLR